jgi:hypothetical protein
MEWFKLQSSMIQKKYIGAAASAILRELEKDLSFRGNHFQPGPAIAVRLGTRWTAASAYTHFGTNMSKRASFIIKVTASAILREISIYLSVEITSSHHRSPGYAMDRRGKRPCTFSSCV